MDTIVRFGLSIPSKLNNTFALQRKHMSFITNIAVTVHTIVYKTILRLGSSELDPGGGGNFNRGVTGVCHLMPEIAP